MGDFDRRKMLDVLVDPRVSSILAELEDGQKNSEYLTERLQVSDQELRERLSYAAEHGFVIIKGNGKDAIFSVDSDKLNRIMESDENFEDVVSGLTELDQFLN